MSSKFNVQQIFVDHWSTIRDYSTGKLSYSEVTLQLLIPASIAIVFYLVVELTAQIGDRIDSGIIAAFSIFTALLFNLQIMIMGMMRTETHEIVPRNENEQLQYRTKRTRSEFIKEIFYNVSYAILVAIALVAISMFVVFFDLSENRLLKTAEVFLVCHFLLVGFMVLKRTHSLFTTFPGG